MKWFARSRSISDKPIKPLGTWDTLRFTAHESTVPTPLVEITPYATSSEWFVDVIKNVVDLSKLNAGWDTYNSAAVTGPAKTQAIRVMTCLNRSRLPAPTIGPISGGGLQFEWNVGPRALELEVLPDGSIEFLRQYEDDRMAEGAIPSDKLDYLREQAGWLIQHPA